MDLVEAVYETGPSFPDRERHSRSSGPSPRPPAPVTYNLLMTIKTWLDVSSQDAERRGLPALRPLLETLARATATLRTADWNFDATGDVDTPELSAAPDAN